MKGKRKGGILERLGNWVLGESPPSLQDAYNNEQSSAPSEWSSKYDDTPLNGARVVDGKFCKTVGEYKAAVKEKYG